MNFVLKKSCQLIATRAFHTTRIHYIKEILVTDSEKTTIIEAAIKSSPRSQYVVQTEGPCKGCPVCRLGLEIKHTDVLILVQFLRSDGCMLPRRITGLCGKQQKRISSMVSMAQKAGILTPPGSKSDPSKRKDYKKFNTYFDESTIKTYGW